MPDVLCVSSTQVLYPLCFGGLYVAAVATGVLRMGMKIQALL